MSEEEEDYMSDAFINGLVEVRPSLIQDRGKKRQIQIETKKSDSNKKPANILSRERLQEGLQCPIESENKGFKLMAKMGYNRGDSLGKCSSSGIKEPIPINLKSDRGGLGREAALKEIEKKRKEIRANRLQRQKDNQPQVTPEEYRQRIAEKVQERFVESALRKCQQSCEDLDHKENINEPHMKWFWPERTELTVEDDNDKDDEHEDEDEDCFEYSPAEKLDMLTNYMRSSYNYCHWCGVLYKDVDDLDTNCPGLLKDDH